MQIKKKTVKITTDTYDVTELSADQYAKVVKALGIKPQGRPVGSTNKAKAVVSKAAKKLSKGRLALVKKSQTGKPKSPSKSTLRPTAAPKPIIIPPAKPSRPIVTLKCPIGGETIKAQGAYNHVVKHGKERGMTEEQAKEAYAGIKKG